MARRNSKKVLQMLPADPYLSAKVAGLRYMMDDRPGIRRVTEGDTIRYFAPDGQEITDEEELKRFRSLTIPPAWTEVWISPSPKGHIQAVGRDAKGRKQYRYHPLYRQVRDLTKFGKLITFVEALSGIRRQVEEDLKLTGLPRRKVLAAVVKVMEQTAIRVGNEEYEKQNGSYGLTTLKQDHAEIEGRTVTFQFRGKSGQDHAIELTDRRLARILKQCQDLPGYDLFQYVDEKGEVVDIKSEDVNDYLREVTGQDFTAKDFRTWAGTVLAAQELTECGCASSDTEAKRNVVAAIKRVAARLGNRPATCKKYYVHPAVLESYLSGLLAEAMKPGGESGDGLRPEERCVAALLRQQLAAEAAKKLPLAVSV